MRRVGELGARARQRWASSDRRRAVRVLVDHEPGLAVVVAVWTVAMAVGPLVSILALGQVLDRLPAAVRSGWSSPAGDALTRALVVLGVSYAVTVALNGIRTALGAIVKVRLTYHMHAALMSAVSRPTGIEHLEDPAILDRLALAHGTLMTFFPADAPLFLADVVAFRSTGFLSCLIIGAYQWWLGVLLLVLNLLMRPRLERAQQNQVQLFAGNGGIMRRALYFNALATQPDAAKEIRVFGLGGWVVDQLTAHWRDGMAAAWANLAQMRNEVARLFTLAALAYLAVVGYLAHQAVTDAASIPRVAVVLGALGTTILLGGMTFADVSLAWTMSALPHLEELDRDLAATAPTAGRPASGLPTERVEFDGVHFAYPGSSIPVFAGLDIRLDAGRSTAIVGPNGAGKTTFVKLLAGLHQPTAGCISVDGDDVKLLDPAAWQRQVAVVFQDFNRYPLTAADNVGLGSPEHLDDRAGIIEAASLAGMADTVAALPDGWDTVLAPDLGGVDLSGGQWQRLALARALFAARHGARILVLDEPTAWLDVRGEAAFYERFLELTRGLTTLVISHRFSTVRLADHIYVVEHGRVVEEGDHDDLVDRGGTYARMFLLQSTHFTGGDGETDAEEVTA